MRVRGFTLIELLVVIVIIGILITMATLSVNVLGRDTEIEDQTKRLNAVLTEVREESELQGHDLGLLVERDGYLFMRYDYGLSQWQVLSNDELTAYRKLPDGLQFRLWLDGREVILKSHQENEIAFANAASSSSSESSSSNSSVSSPLGALTSIAANTVALGVRPQIAILSSGDIMPFELQLARDGGDFNWHLVGGADNTLLAEVNQSAR